MPKYNTTNAIPTENDISTPEFQKKFIDALKENLTKTTPLDRANHFEKSIIEELNNCKNISGNKLFSDSTLKDITFDSSQKDPTAFIRASSDIIYGANTPNVEKISKKPAANITEYKQKPSHIVSSNALQLPLITSDSVITTSQLLQNYQDPEEIPDINFERGDSKQFESENLSTTNTKKEKAHKQHDFLLHQDHNEVIIQLKRFEYDNSTGIKRKLINKISLDDLKLKNFSYTSQQNSSTFQELDSTSQLSATAFICHIGNHFDSGHYVAYVKYFNEDEQKAQWYCFDDSSVSLVEESEIEDFKQKSYIIKYSKIQTNEQGQEFVALPYISNTEQKSISQGVSNLGNTCYANSALALLSTLDAIATKKLIDIQDFYTETEKTTKTPPQDQKRKISNKALIKNKKEPTPTEEETSFLTAITKRDYTTINQIWKNATEQTKISLLTQKDYLAIQYGAQESDILLQNLSNKILKLSNVPPALLDALLNIQTAPIELGEKTRNILSNLITEISNRETINTKHNSIKNSSTQNAKQKPKPTPPKTQPPAQTKKTEEKKSPRGSAINAVKFINESKTKEEEKKTIADLHPSQTTTPKKNSNQTKPNDKNKKFIEALRNRNQEIVKQLLPDLSNSNDIAAQRELLYLLHYQGCAALKAAIEGDTINIALIDVANKIFATRETTKEIKKTVQCISSHSNTEINSFNKNIFDIINNDLNSKFKKVINSTIFEFLEAITTNNTGYLEQIWNDAQQEQQVELLQDINYAATKIAMEQEFLTLINVINKITSLGQVPEDFRTNLHAEISNHETTTMIPPENQRSVEVLKTHLNNKNLSPKKESKPPNTEEPQTNIRPLSSNSQTTVIKQI